MDITSADQPHPTPPMTIGGPLQTDHYARQTPSPQLTIDLWKTTTLN